MNFREKKERLHYLLHRKGKGFLSSSAFLKLYLSKKPNTEENQEGTYFSSFIVIFYFTLLKGFVNSWLYIHKRVFVRLYIRICLNNCFNVGSLVNCGGDEARSSEKEVGLGYAPSSSSASPCSKCSFSEITVCLLLTQSYVFFFAPGLGRVMFLSVFLFYIYFKMQNWSEKLLIS